MMRGEEEREEKEEERERRVGGWEGDTVEPLGTETHILTQYTQSPSCHTNTEPLKTHFELPEYITL